MAQGQIEIDNNSILDNIDAELVEFTAEVDGDDYEFAVQYDLLEALSGDRPDGDGVEMLNRFIDQVSDAALSALSRNSDANPIVVSEADLE
ncbi:hypothetical protein CA236_13000 [Sphingomonas sp. ABOLG]|jgi:hypothetical protein|uniref:DUF1488 family protein n=1 Tax=Sphingomonas olei TaxID=1886787 RepID=A0ABY2QE02_9SPHN|nr:MULTISPECIES: hypothetical protein [Sphingomonas]KKI18542.1 hypothetical protein XM50_12150 [Sphingomonas sp. Ag1]MDF2604707.1 hypothetical protein [Sphingomonas sp.]RSV16559.1 hypothetical protein CA236_13000 [Sphingomonas sp. ABOLG]THG38460.1 hypothetical protein E5988_14205 [Sphingomonas olei]